VSRTASDPRAAIETLAGSLRSHGVADVELALVLGSGLGAFADELEDASSIPYAELDGMPESAVPGHAGRLVAGTCRGRRVLVQQGRVHLYEGWSPFEVTRAVRAFARVGVRAVLLTNASGGLHADWLPGTLMRVTDHVNLQGASPLFAGEAGAHNPYDVELGSALDRAAAAAGVELRSGVYVGMLGPTYETPAEVRLLQSLGGDAVGMSTVAEAAAARASGLRVAAISCVTNPGAGLSPGPVSHADVVEAGKRAAGAFRALLEHAVASLEL
jgi:purine-nucleoside phosphorylase